jgi:hypothetical protein
MYELAAAALGLHKQAFKLQAVIQLDVAMFCCSACHKHAVKVGLLTFSLPSKLPATSRANAAAPASFTVGG